CSTDNNLAARRLNDVLRGGQTDVPVIRSIIETKTAYTTFPESAKVRPTPIITYTSQCDSVLEEFTKIFEKGAKYNKTASITQLASLKTFTTDTYPGLRSLLQPSTTTDALPLSSHTAPPPPTTLPAFLNPTDLPPRLRAPFAQYHDISVTGPTLTAFTTAAVVTELPQQLLLHTCAIFHRKNKPQKGYVKEFWVCKCSEDPFRSSKTRVDLRPSQGTTSTASVPRPATTSTACGCTASFSITPVKPKTGDPATQIVKICRLHNQSTFQIKRAHKHFLKGFVPTLGLAYADLGQDVDHRFFPFPSDIKNAINEAARASRHAQVDQESTLLYFAAEAETEKFSWAFRSDGQQALTYTYDDSAHTLGCNVFSITQGGHRFLESSQEVLTTGGLREVTQPLVPDILSRTPPPPPFLRIEQPSTDLCLPESHPSVSEMQEIVKHLIQPLPHFASKEFLVIDLDQFTTSLTAPFLPTNPLHLPFHQQKCLFAFVHEPAGEWRLFVLDAFPFPVPPRAVVANAPYLVPSTPSLPPP
ncbi:hypothetical protein CYMTET_44089, partial [Cymbomonas tetramitiformis]